MKNPFTIVNINNNFENVRTQVCNKLIEYHYNENIVIDLLNVWNFYKNYIYDNHYNYEKMIELFNGLYDENIIIILNTYNLLEMINKDIAENYKNPKNLEIINNNLIQFNFNFKIHHKKNDFEKNGYQYLYDETDNLESLKKYVKYDGIESSYKNLFLINEENFFNMKKPNDYSYKNCYDYKTAFMMNELNEEVILEKKRINDEEIYKRIKKMELNK